MTRRISSIASARSKCDVPDMIPSVEAAPPRPGVYSGNQWPTILEVAVETEAKTNSTKATPAKKKGQRALTWDAPGEWTYDPDKRLKHCLLHLGVDERGAATSILVV